MEFGKIYVFASLLVTCIFFAIMALLIWFEKVTGDGGVFLLLCGSSTRLAESYVVITNALGKEKSK